MSSEDFESMDSIISSMNDFLNQRSITIQSKAYSLCSDSESRFLFAGGKGSIKVSSEPHFQSSHILEGDQMEVTCMVFHEGYLYSGSRDNKLSCWHFESSTCFDRIEAHSETIFDIKISESTSEIVTSSADNTIQFRSLVQLNFKREIAVQNFQPFELAIFGQTLAAACSDYTIKTWELRRLTPMREYVGHEGLVLCICVDTHHLISGSSDKTLRVWNLTTARTEGVLIGHTDVVRQVELSHDFNYVFSASEDATIRIWHKMKIIGILHTKFPINVLHVNSKFIFAALKNGQIRAWELQETWKQVTFEGPSRSISHIQIGNGLVFTSGNKKALTVWDLNTKSYKSMLKFKATTIVKFALHKSLPLIILATAAIEIIVWDLEKESPEASFKCHVDEIIYVEWYSLQESISVSRDGKIVVYDFVQKLKKISLDLSSIENARLSLHKDYLVGYFNKSVQVFDFAKKEIKSFNAKNRIVSADIDKYNQNIVLGTENGTIEVWHQLRFESALKGHTSEVTCVRISNESKFLYSTSADKTLKFWNFEQKFLYGSISFSHGISAMEVTDVFLLSIGNQLVALEDPFHSDDIAMLGPNSLSFIFSEYLYNIAISPSHFQTLLPEMTRWVVLPYKVNLMHISCYYGHKSIVKQCMKFQSPFYRLSQLGSPLSISMAYQRIDCTEIIAKHINLVLSGKKSCAFEEDILQLNRTADNFLPHFYNATYSTPDQDLPIYGKLKGKPPIVHLSSTSEISTENFLTVGEDDVSRVEFRSTTFRMNFLMGSLDSVNFLQSLRDTDSKEVFRTPFIRHYLTYKWEKARKLIWARGILYLMLVMSLLAQVFNSSYSSGLLMVLFCVNTLFLAFEVIQIMISRRHFSNFWNIIDALVILLIYFFCVNEELQVVSEYEQVYLGYLGCLLLLVWARGISYFRVFSKTRYMIRMIVEILADMKSFLIILLYIVIGFTFVYNLLSDDNFVEAFVHVYRLDFGDYDVDSYQGIGIAIWFLIATILNPLILLNMLIAVMSDTYDRVQEYQDVADLREMADVILECEAMLFWRKDSGEMSYFQVAFPVNDEKQQEQAWQGRIHAIKKMLNQVKISQVNLEREMNEKIDKIDKMAETLTKQMSLQISENPINYHTYNTERFRTNL